MDDQDWINLQKLAGRPPQPSFADPETPAHILYAKALEALGRPQAPDPDLPGIYARALGSLGQAAAPRDGLVESAVPEDEQVALPLADAPTFGQPVNSSAAGPGAGAGASTRNGAPDSETRHVTASPANVDLPWQSLAERYVEPPPTPKPAAAPAPAPAPVAQTSVQTTIDPIPGYDETGADAWRTANDPAFLDAVNRYNAANGYRPGDPGYWTADKL